MTCLGCSSKARQRPWLCSSLSWSSMLRITLGDMIGHLVFHFFFRQNLSKVNSDISSTRSLILLLRYSLQFTNQTHHDLLKWGLLFFFLMFCPNTIFCRLITLFVFRPFYHFKMKEKGHIFRLGQRRPTSIFRVIDLVQSIA